VCNNDFLPVLDKLYNSEEHDVLLVDGQSNQIALLGELFSFEANRRRLAAIIVDGAVRDMSSLASLQIPIYTKYVNPMSGSINQISTNESVSIADVTVREGDIMIGDRDGIIVLSEDELNRLAPKAKAIQDKERLIIQHIKEGKSLFDFINFKEHLELRKAGKESQLTFLT